MATKLEKLVAYGEVKEPKQKNKKNKKKFLQKMYDRQKLQDADAWWGDTHNKYARLWSSDHKKLRVKLKT